MNVNNYVTISRAQRRHTEAMLNKHLPVKHANRDWLADTLEGKFNHFPYVIDSGIATIAEEIIYPNHPCKTDPKPTDNAKPLYLANIPMAHRLFEEGYTHFTQLLALFEKESFSRKDNLKKRLAIVIGINQIDSIDEEANRAFRGWIQSLPLTKAVVHRAFGFFWKPKWKKKEATAQASYPIKKAFLIVKLLDQSKATLIRENLEGKAGRIDASLAQQIPFQHLRQKIKTSHCTTAFANSFCKQNQKAPIYFAVLDADVKKLKTKTALFARTDAAILNNNIPSALTLGYNVIEPTRPLIELGVRIDMAVREAMTKVISYSAYFPEPFSLFLVRRPKKLPHLTSLSFLGAGRVLENRRLIQNGLQSKCLKNDCVFLADGGVTTTTPSRMKTLKNKAITRLTPSVIKQKATLMALRAVSQTHATPKQWADNLYIALDFKAKLVTDATGPMMHFFSLYDPISRIFSRIGHYSSNTFDRVIKNYYAPLTEAQMNLRTTIRTKLIQLGMKSEMVDKIEDAAKASGAAICSILSSETGVLITPLPS